MTVHRALFSILLFIFSVQLSFGQMIQGQDTLVGNEWITYGQKYYKFSLNEDGVYRISLSVLQGAGIAEETAQGAKFRIFNKGVQVPLYVSTDAQFGGSDYIEFYGYRNRGELDQYLFAKPSEDMLHPDHSMYTDDNVYYLTLEGTDSPLRVETLINNPSQPPAPAAYYLHSEVISYTAGYNDLYFPVSGGGSVSYSSYLHAEGFCKAAETNTTVQIPALSRYVTGPDATLHLRMTSTNYSDNLINRLHYFVVSLNSQVLDTITATNIQIKDFTYTVPISLLIDDNQFKITSINPASRESLVSVELTYAHTTILNSTPQASILINGPSESQHFIFDGFPHQGIEPVIYSFDGKQRMIASIDGLNRVEFVWPEISVSKRIDIVDPSAGIKLITQLDEKEFTDYKSDNTEYVIITRPDLMEVGTGS
ncbi:MAG: hypothetical protein ABJC12_10870, partial [Saprospiraceae bacterium]